MILPKPYFAVPKRRRTVLFSSAAPREKPRMRIHKILQRRIHAAIHGVDLRGDVNAAVAANVGERSQTTYASSRSEADTSPQRPGDDKNDPRRDVRAKGDGG